MWYYFIKVLVSALIIVTVSEIAKRNSGFAALIAALPLTSLLAIVWLRIEGAEGTQLAELSQQIFWLVIPSLLLFLLFPMLIKFGVSFWVSLSLASAATIMGYLLMIPLLRRFGVSI